MYPKFLGLGSAFNPDMGNNGAYFHVGEQLVMFDCGETAFWAINRNDLFNGFKHVHVFITHNHSDHIGSLATMLWYAYYVAKVKVSIYATPELFTILDLMGTLPELYTKHILSPETSYEIAPVLGGLIYTIQPIRVEHVNTMTCYGFCVKSTNNERFYYSGDAKAIPEPVLKALMAKKLDRLYQDCSWIDYPDSVHLSYLKLCALVPIEYRSQVYPMHLEAGFNINKARADGFSFET